MIKNEDEYEDDFEIEQNIQEDITEVPPPQIEDIDTKKLIEQHAPIQNDLKDDAPRKSEQSIPSEIPEQKEDEVTENCKESNKQSMKNPSNFISPQSDQIKDQEFEKIEENKVNSEYENNEYEDNDTRNRNLSYDYHSNIDNGNNQDAVPNIPMQFSSTHKAIYCNLDTFDSNNPKCKIASPRSLQIIKREGINVEDLYTKSKLQIKSMNLCR